MNTKLFFLKANGKEGAANINGEIIIPIEYNSMESIGKTKLVVSKYFISK